MDRIAFFEKYHLSIIQCFFDSIFRRRLFKCGRASGCDDVDRIGNLPQAVFGMPCQSIFFVQILLTLSHVLFDSNKP